jgi:hypothetical protein
MKVLFLNLLLILYKRLCNYDIYLQHDKLLSGHLLNETFWMGLLVKWPLNVPYSVWDFAKLLQAVPQSVMKFFPYLKTRVQFTAVFDLDPQLLPPSSWPRGTLYSQKLALTLPTSGCRSVGIVLSRTQAMEYSFSYYHLTEMKYYLEIIFVTIHEIKYWIKMSNNLPILTSPYRSDRLWCPPNLLSDG